MSVDGSFRQGLRLLEKPVCTYRGFALFFPFRLHHVGVEEEVRNIRPPSRKSCKKAEAVGPREKFCAASTEARFHRLVINFFDAIFARRTLVQDFIEFCVKYFCKYCGNAEGSSQEGLGTPFFSVEFH